MPVITFNLNGNPVSVDADNDEELLWVLRDRLDTKGLKSEPPISEAAACQARGPGRLSSCDHSVTTEALRSREYSR